MRGGAVIGASDSKKINQKNHGFTVCAAVWKHVQIRPLHIAPVQLAVRLSNWQIRSLHIAPIHSAVSMNNRQ